MTTREWEALGARRTLFGNAIFVVDLPAEQEVAEPVLVLHGFPTSSFDWHRVVGALQTSRRVVLLDLLGYGYSDKPDRRYSLFEQADLVEVVARELGLREVALVSHDMGDSVAGELLARSIDAALGFTVTRRVLTNGSIYLEMARLTDGQQLLLAMPDEMLHAGEGFPLEMIEAALAATCSPAHAPDSADIAAMAALVVLAGGERLLPRLIRYVEERRVYERRWTGAIETHPSPLAIVWGDADPIAVWPMAERLQEARPDSTLERLTGVGHYPMVEVPGPFADALVAALR